MRNVLLCLFVSLYPFSPLIAEETGPPRLLRLIPAEPSGFFAWFTAPPESEQLEGLKALMKVLDPDVGKIDVQAKQGNREVAVLCRFPKRNGLLVIGEVKGFVPPTLHFDVLFWQEWNAMEKADQQRLSDFLEAFSKMNRPEAKLGRLKKLTVEPQERRRYFDCFLDFDISQEVGPEPSKNPARSSTYPEE